MGLCDTEIGPITQEVLKMVIHKKYTNIFLIYLYWIFSCDNFAIAHQIWIIWRSFLNSENDSEIVNRPIRTGQKEMDSKIAMYIFRAPGAKRPMSGKYLSFYVFLREYINCLTHCGQLTP